MSTLKTGLKAPSFSGTDQNGNKVSSKDYKGKKLVLYFYPKDLTETCTIQATNIRDNISLLKKAGFEVVGVSPDPVNLHKKFSDKYKLPFPLIADESHSIIRKYGVWGEKLLYGKKYMGLLRTTFLIDEKGIIKKIIQRPKSKKHVEEILQYWNEAEAGRIPK